MTAEKDIVLIHYEGKPLAFARIEAILPDHKPGWYHVRLLLLQVPVQIVTWILRDVYIDGESFTMNGKQMRLERIEPPAVEEDASGEGPPPNGSPGDEKPAEAKVISLADLKRK